MKLQIKEDTKGMTYNQIIDYGVKVTAKSLYFSDHCEQVNFKKPVAAHCVGYARTLSSIYNYAFHVNNINARSYPVVGYIKLAGINVNALIGKMVSDKKLKNFTKDHDFTKVIYGHRIDYIDASTYDLLHNDFHTITSSH